jgi:copper resistance protein C
MLAGALLALIVAAPVLAHTELVASDPADGAVLAVPPATVTVTFSETIDPDRSRFKLVGPGGTVGIGRVADDAKVLVLGRLDLGPGAYEIQWTVASKDGHIERGRIRFAVSAPTPAPPTAPPTEPVPTATPATSAASSSPTVPGTTAGPATSAPSALPPSGGASPTPATGPAEPAAGSAGDVLLPIIVAVVVVAGVGAYVLRRGRRA